MAHETPRMAADRRERFGSRYAQRLRREGKLPAVIYGREQQVAHIVIDRDTLIGHLHAGAHLLEIEQDGKSETCQIKDIQYDYLGTGIIHVDLTRVSMTDQITVSVPVELRGEDECPGAKAAGAIVEHPLKDLEVTCRADRIPDAVEVDISELDVEQSILVGDLKLPEGVTTEQHPEDVVVAIRIIEEEPEEEAPEAAEAEPEVLSERHEEPADEAEPEKRERSEKKK